MQKFPVLNYHGLVSLDSSRGRGSRFWVSRHAFASHLEQIRRHCAGARKLSELWGAAHTFNCDSSTAITFDDGRVSDYEIAYPLLAESGFAADFFINPSSIGQNGYLTWQQVREMHREGMAFQSHGNEHVDHSGLSAADLRLQLHDSKREIEDRIGAEVPFFAAPYGEWNRQVADVAWQVGYRAICTSDGQLARRDRKIIDRIGIDAQTSFKRLDAILTAEPMYFALEAARFRLKRLPKLIAMRLMPNTVQAWRDRQHA